MLARSLGWRIVVLEFALGILVALSDDIIAVLKDEHTKKISISFGSVKIDASGYLDVTTAIKDGKIAVSHNSKLGSYAGEYIYKPNNKFSMGFEKVGADESRMALIVHEASHALFDIKLQKMKVKESEAAAYIAQVLYLYYSWGYDDDDDGELTDPTLSNGILKAAWPIAKSIASGGSVEDAALEKLYDEIGKDSKYDGRLELDEDIDG